jgi:Holliday junction resolvase-like predicted endonuclease
MKHTKEHSTNRKGDLAEFYAVTWLWDNGYEVFKNCGCDGFIDLVARDPKGNITLIDVKTARRDYRTEDSYTSRTTRTKKQIKADVKYLLYLPDTRKLRWVEHNDK